MNAPEAPGRRLLRTRDAAEYLGISPTSVNKLRREGRLRSVLLTNDHRYDIKDLDALIELNKSEVSRPNNKNKEIK